MRDWLNFIEEAIYCNLEYNDLEEQYAARKPREINLKSRKTVGM
jgi:hypothetical protein